MTDRVYEFNFIKNVLKEMFSKKDEKIKSDNLVINMILLSLMLDFGLCEFKELLNVRDLPSI